MQLEKKHALVLMNLITGSKTKTERKKHQRIISDYCIKNTGKQNGGGVNVIQQR